MNDHSAGKGKPNKMRDGSLNSVELSAALLFAAICLFDLKFV